MSYQNLLLNGEKPYTNLNVESVNVDISNNSVSHEKSAFALVGGAQTRIDNLVLVDGELGQFNNLTGAFTPDVSGFYCFRVSCGETGAAANTDLDYMIYDEITNDVYVLKKTQFSALHPIFNGAVDTSDCVYLESGVSVYLDVQVAVNDNVDLFYQILKV